MDIEEILELIREKLNSGTRVEQSLEYETLLKSIVNTADAMISIAEKEGNELAQMSSYMVASEDLGAYTEEILKLRKKKCDEVMAWEKLKKDVRKIQKAMHEV